MTIVKRATNRAIITRLFAISNQLRLNFLETSETESRDEKVFVGLKVDGSRRGGEKKYRGHLPKTET